MIHLGCRQAEAQGGMAEKAAGRAGDAALAALYAVPALVSRPAEQTIPFIFASPHSGRLYPAGFVASSRLSPLFLRRSEDAFADLLFGAAVALGAPMIAARFPRALVDVNRGPAELDAAMFDGPLTVPVDAPSARVQAGLGVIPRVVRDGAEIYRAKLAPVEAAERLERLYRPYHAALAGLVAETQARFGVAVVVDCHSMPSAATAPDVVLGDRYGTSAMPALVRHAQQSFELKAFMVARNQPYAGGHTTERYGRPADGVQALQIEINRALYLDEERVTPNANFDAVCARLGEVLASLTAMTPAALRAGAQAMPWAAE